MNESTGVGVGCSFMVRPILKESGCPSFNPPDTDQPDSSTRRTRLFFLGVSGTGMASSVTWDGGGEG